VRFQEFSHFLRVGKIVLAEINVQREMLRTLEFPEGVLQVFGILMNLFRYIILNEQRLKAHEGLMQPVELIQRSETVPHVQLSGEERSRIVPRLQRRRTKIDVGKLQVA